MSSKVITKEGVVAELNGRYFGIQYEDGYSTAYGFGPIENATVRDTKWCRKPKDMTWPDSPYVEKLKKSTLKPVQIRTVYTVYE